MWGCRVASEVTDEEARELRFLSPLSSHCPAIKLLHHFTLSSEPAGPQGVHVHNLSPFAPSSTDSMASSSIKPPRPSGPVQSVGPGYRSASQKPSATVSTEMNIDNVHILPQTPQLIALLT